MYLQEVTTGNSTGLPVTLGEGKDHLRITASNQDDDIKDKLFEATEYCQRRISGHRQFMPKTFDAVSRAFPWRITLPMPPLQSVTAVQFIPTTGSTYSTVSTTGYNVFTPTDAPGFIEPELGETWPTAKDQADGVRVRFVAGYASRAVVPRTVKAAVKMKLEQLHDPERVDEEEVEQSIDRLLGTNEYGFYG